MAVSVCVQHLLPVRFFSPNTTREVTFFSLTRQISMEYGVQYVGTFSDFVKWIEREKNILSTLFFFGAESRVATNFFF